MGDRVVTAHPATEAPRFLTPHQFPIVHHEGNFFLTACPGSGKTRTTAVRIARLIQDQASVAATSYTNVGAEQLGSLLAGELGFVVPPSCFLGTLHGFLLRYVFYPFGHLVMACGEKRPTVLGEDAWPDVTFGNNAIRLPCNDFSFRPDGSLIIRGSLPLGIATHEVAMERGEAAARRIKTAMAAKGYASADDSIYWALRVLEDRPEIAAAVARRFDELVVDEAQDTSELQLACLSILHATDYMKSLCLVGDFEQSIYSFQGASPSGCDGLAMTARLTALSLRENHRSSQLLCDTAVHFCRRDEPDRAVGSDAHAGLPPEILLYDPQAESEVIQRFTRRLGRLSITTDDAAVLARNRRLAAAINHDDDSADCGSRVFAVGTAAASLEARKTLNRRDVQAIDRIVAFMALDIHDLNDLDNDQRSQIRARTSVILKALPSLDLDLKTWITQMRVIVGREAEAIQRPLAHLPGNALKTKASHSTIIARDAFAPAEAALRAQTIHDVKGESRTAVLVVGDKGTPRRPAQALEWSDHIETGELISNEEIRILYVAITRAQKYCAIALPANTEPSIIARFHSVGFVGAPDDDDAETAPS